MKMCTCRAFTYGSCKLGHCKFESVTVCVQVRLRLKECQEKIVNGKEGEVRGWPTIPGICPECFPEAAAKEAEKKKREVDDAIRKVSDLPTSASFPEIPLEAFVYAADAMA